MNLEPDRRMVSCRQFDITCNANHLSHLFASERRLTKIDDRLLLLDGVGEAHMTSACGEVVRLYSSVLSSYPSTCHRHGDALWRHDKSRIVLRTAASKTINSTSSTLRTLNNSSSETSSARFDTIMLYSVYGDEGELANDK